MQLQSSRLRVKLLTTEPAKAKPIFKWAGGKSWFVKEFGDAMFEHVVKRGCYYIEPFLGGAAMALHLGYKRMVLSDVEHDLMYTYAAIRGETSKVLAGLDELRDHHVEEAQSGGVGARHRAVSP